MDTKVEGLADDPDPKGHPTESESDPDTTEDSDDPDITDNQRRQARMLHNYTRYVNNATPHQIWLKESHLNI